MRRILPTLTAVILLAFVASPAAFAEDIWGDQIPGWTRGDPGSTFQHWQFGDQNSNSPESCQNEYGSPTFEFESSSQWHWDNLPGPQGQEIPVSVWFTLDTGTMIFHVPNRPELNEIKKIFVQITSTKGPSSVTAVGGGGGPNGYTTGEFPTGLAEIQHSGDWYTYNYGLTIEPNPEFEVS